MMAVLGFTACAQPEAWSPVVDVATDPYAAQLPGDTAQCRQLALQVGANDVTARTKSTQWTEGGTIINTGAYHRAFATCLSKRHHPVLDAAN